MVRGLGSMIQGLASQLGQIADKGLVSGEAPAAAPAGAVAVAESEPEARGGCHAAESREAEAEPEAPAEERRGGR